MARQEKITVVTPAGEHWEYRCGSCGQLRFYPCRGNDEKPERCGSCGSVDIQIGRPGTLPTEE